MRLPIIFLLFLSHLAPTCANPLVELEQTDEGVAIQIDGTLFATYLKQSGRQPVVWPIIGPTGAAYTRSFPIGPLADSEKDDHPHHRSLWFAHGDVNGYDFWANTVPDQHCEILQREFVKQESNHTTATIVTRNDWVASGRKQCEDVRTLVFGGNDDNRWIDFTVTLIASEGELKLGDTKEGTFAVRVAGTMKVDSPGKGEIVNDRGHKDKAAWGLPAEWIDYHGPVGGKRAGIAILSHPNSFRHPCKWHVRTYGLIAANPFGEDDFPPSGVEQGAVTVAAGDRLTLRYRVVFHLGDEKAANIGAQYKAFVKEPTSSNTVP